MIYRLNVRIYILSHQLQIASHNAFQLICTQNEWKYLSSFGLRIINKWLDVCTHDTTCMHCIARSSAIHQRREIWKAAKTQAHCKVKTLSAKIMKNESRLWVRFYEIEKVHFRWFFNELFLLRSNFWCD